MPFVDDGFALSALGIFTAFSDMLIDSRNVKPETNGAAFSTYVALIPYAVMVLRFCLILFNCISFTI